MKPFLFIARHFPPEAGGGVQRAAKMAKYLVEHGYMARVLAAPARGAQDPSLVAELPAEVEIHRLPVAIGARSSEWAKVVKLGRPRRSLIQYALLGDEGLADLPEAVTRGLGLSQNAAAIVATSLPFSSIAAGAIVARRSRLPLVADLRDPWAFAPRDRAASEMHRYGARRLEEWALDRAAAISIVTESMREHLPKSAADRAVVVPNGFDPADFEVPEEPRGGQTFRVVYAGSLYGARRPEPILSALKNLEAPAKKAGKPLDIVIAGSTFEHDAALRDSGLPIEIRGYRPHREVISLLKSADLILVIVGVEAADRHAPSGKLYEAIAAGPPVIAWAPVDGEASAVLSSTGAGLAVENEAQLFEAASAVLDGALEVKPLAERKLAAYDRRTSAKKLARILDALT